MTSSPGGHGRHAPPSGPPARVRTGGTIHPDVANRLLEVDLDDATPAARREAWCPPPPAGERGRVGVYAIHALQADRAAGLEFLVGAGGREVPRRAF